MKRIIVLCWLLVTSLNALANVDCATVTYLSTDCYVESLPGSSVRASNPDAFYSFETGRYPYTKYNGTLTADQVQGISWSFAAFYGQKYKVFSFNEAPGAPSLSSQVNDSKSRMGFYYKPIFDADRCTIVFGSSGGGGEVKKNGSYQCVLIGDVLTYGIPPDSQSYVMVYGQATMAALRAQSPHATIGNVNVFVQQLFNCMRDLSQYDGGHCYVPLMGRFSMNAKTGKWTFKKEIDYYEVTEEEPNEDDSYEYCDDDGCYYCDNTGCY